MKDFSQNQRIMYACAANGYRSGFLTFFRVLFAPSISGSTGQEYDYAIKMINRMARSAYFNYPHYRENVQSYVQEIVQAVAYFVSNYGPSLSIGSSQSDIRRTLWDSEAWSNKTKRQTLIEEVRAFMAYLTSVPDTLFERSSRGNDVRREYKPNQFWWSAVGDFDVAKPDFLFNTDLGTFGKRPLVPSPTASELTPREWWTVYQHTIPKEVKEKVFYALFQHSV